MLGPHAGPVEEPPDLIELINLKEPLVHLLKEEPSVVGGLLGAIVYLDKGVAATPEKGRRGPLAARPGWSLFSPRQYAPRYVDLTRVAL